MLGLWLFLRVSPRHAHAQHVRKNTKGHLRARTKRCPFVFFAHVPEAHVYAEGRDIDGCFASGDTRSSIRVYTGRRDREASVDTRIHLLKIQLDKIHCAQYNLIKDNSTPTTHFRKGEQAYENSL